MGDRVDDLMSRVMPDIRKQIADVLSNESKLDDFVTVTSTDETMPYRVTNSGWQRHGQDPALASAIPKARLLEYGGTLVKANELVVRTRFVADVSYAPHPNDEPWQLAHTARLAERRAVLQLVTEGQETQRGPLETTIVNEAAKLGGRCRLITDDPEIARKLKRDGTVDEAISSQGALPNGIDAVLVPIDNGPIVQRIEDLTSFWERPGADAGAAPHEVDLVVAGRFFFDSGTPSVPIAEAR